MIPGYKDMLLKVLRLLENGSEVKRRDIIEKLANYYKEHPDFKMSEEERNKFYTKSGTNIFNFRVGWTIWHLKISNLLERVNIGTIKITEKGKKLLSSIPSIITDSEFADLIDKDTDHIEFIKNMEALRKARKKREK
ncbi:MAG: winged helix-turn-helix domain-containing protein [Thermodesulfovibrio sp.]|nr:winged helix-turn-helix domain-containing protein [Thermodesulfovibrio sp.]MDW7999214.1 winged helix-turn-helix domain-containing protein [Thermodesulfovibrio sp.]